MSLPEHFDIRIQSTIDKKDFVQAAKERLNNMNYLKLQTFSPVVILSGYILALFYLDLVNWLSLSIGALLFVFSIFTLFVYFKTASLAEILWQKIQPPKNFDVTFSIAGIKATSERGGFCDLTWQDIWGYEQTRHFVFFYFKAGKLITKKKDIKKEELVLISELIDHWAVKVIGNRSS